ncbi:ATP-dependent helicase HrpB [Chromatocurvus halotolerans]|uniref:ATP-dependent helicase HrpB n=1 Tax=Chromatocurvus halotolerans TaxID=1132028 RepID=A0A4R2LA09_9GAMM|nr:ATP-dependent helicase HrpB [Chromatocurvus halotolerans]TCO76085.1 ATP-dependent helicase HrpB [Chromatocurvus halotolerans]
MTGANKRSVRGPLATWHPILKTGMPRRQALAMLARIRTAHYRRCHDPDAQTMTLSAVDNALPIQAVIGDIRAALIGHDTLLLEAPPGAGKTTVVPLALLDEPWLAGRRIVILQPRRLAARTAAARMAELLGEAPGETVGYRIRLDSRVSARTRIEVITEGILLRMLREDPALESVGLLIFDEFHERSVDADLGLALALHGRATFEAANAARIIVMSATLGDASLEHYLDAPRIRCEGRQYPVTLRYGAALRPRESVVDSMVAALETVCRDHPQSSVLAFLPGRGEIHRVAAGLSLPAGTQVHPLYGDLDMSAQRRAIAPCPAGIRKVVLATNVAETSLTIDGVDVVVDAGLERQARFDPGSGMSRLHTQAISQASAVQRAGRAGRLRPGFCYRLWSESRQAQLSRERSAGIEVADLAPLVLQLFAFGIYSADELDWLTPPPAGAFAQAVDLLAALGAIAGEPGKRRMTPYGNAMAGLAVHPRLAHLLLAGRDIAAARHASLIAAALSEGLPRQGESADLRGWLDLLDGDASSPGRLKPWVARTREVAAQLRRQLPDGEVSLPALPARPDDAQVTGYLLACAYPDRIARRRHSGAYQLSNGRSARFESASPLQREKWLAVAEVSGMSGGRSDTIRAAAPLDVQLFSSQLAPLLREQTRVGWDRQSGLFVAERQRRIGALLLASETLSEVTADQRVDGLLALIAEADLDNLPWTSEAENYRARAALMASLVTDWPAFDRQALCDTVSDWLALYLAPVKKLSDLKKIDLIGALKARLSFAQQQQLDRWLPERCEVPSGSRVKIDYSQQPPVLPVKLQEMFGARETPTLAEGRLALVVHLLSPAGRPLQVTQDLVSFWNDGYDAVRKEMRGRYPKHPWPDDPLQAVATAHTKKRASGTSG